MFSEHPRGQGNSHLVLCELNSPRGIVLLHWLHLTGIRDKRFVTIRELTLEKSLSRPVLHVGHFQFALRMHALQNELLQPLCTTGSTRGPKQIWLHNNSSSIESSST